MERYADQYRTISKFQYSSLGNTGGIWLKEGNKIINIPTTRVTDGVEFVVAIAVLSPQDGLIVYAGRRHHRLRASDLEHYRGERGRRGNKLPRGFQNVDRIEVSGKDAAE